MNELFIVCIQIITIDNYERLYDITLFLWNYTKVQSDHEICFIFICLVAFCQLSPCQTCLRNIDLNLSIREEKEKNRGAMLHTW